MMRLAWVSPFPPERSGIADHSVELVTALLPLAEVVLFVNDPAAFDVPALNHLPRWSIEQLGEKRFEFDVPVYQMGNHTLHRKIYEQALLYPGFLILHERSLQVLFHELILLKDGGSTLMRELIYERPEQVPQVIQQTADLFTLPDLDFFRRLVDGSLGVAVHSAAMQKQIGGKNSVVLPLAAAEPAAEYDWPDTPAGRIVFSCGGLITPSKQIDRVLNGLQQLVADGIDARLLLVGDVAGDVPLADWIADRGLAERVERVGFVESIGEFEANLARSHVVINLRQPTIGETSAVVVRSMGIGRPVIVYDHGWYEELPDSCVKIEPGSQEALTEAMRSAAADVPKLKVMGQECQAVFAKNHRPEAVASRLVKWLLAFGS